MGRTCSAAAGVRAGIGMQILACPDAVKGALLPGGRVRLRVRYPFTPKTSPRVRLWGGSAVALVGVEPPLVGWWAHRSSSSSVIEFNEEAVLAIGTRGPTLPDGPREHLFDSTRRCVASPRRLHRCYLPRAAR